MRFALPLRLAAVLAPAGCGVPATGMRTETAARGYLYADDAGIAVSTLALSAETKLATELAVEGRALVEEIRVDGDGSGNTAHAHGGHQHGAPALPAPGGEVDVISSASTTARGDTASLVRYEAQLGARTGVGNARAPADAGIEARVSTEPDYLSLSSAVFGRVDLFERNLSLAASLGVARDRISPEEPPEEGTFPAHHERVYLGLSLAQVLGPRTLVSFALTLARQAGTLENPYRRVLVKSALYPERVPDLRNRLIGAVGLAQYLGHGFALHLRNGVYADDWRVLAWIPEVAVAWDLSRRALFEAHARWYAQSRARFYAPSFETRGAELSADVRLGAIRERSFGASVEVPLPSFDDLGILSMNGGYDLSLLEYRALDRDVVGHTASLGVRLELD